MLENQRIPYSDAVHLASKVSMTGALGWQRANTPSGVHQAQAAATDSNPRQFGIESHGWRVFAGRRGVTCSLVR